LRRDYSNFQNSATHEQEVVTVCLSRAGGDNVTMDAERGTMKFRKNVFSLRVHHSLFLLIVCRPPQTLSTSHPVALGFIQ
jgi:hypothetical protein